MTPRQNRFISNLWATHEGCLNRRFTVAFSISFYLGRKVIDINHPDGSNVYRLEFGDSGWKLINGYREDESRVFDLLLKV